MFFQLEVDNDDIMIVQNNLNHAEELLNELINYKKLNFIKRMFTKEVFEDINVKFAKQHIDFARINLYRILENKDIYHISNEYQEKLYKLLDKSFKLDLIIMNLDEYIKNESYRKWINIRQYETY